MRRRAFLLAAAPFAAPARAQSALWPERFGAYAGALRFYGSIPLEDIYPPPASPHVDLDDRAPFGVFFAIQPDDGGTVIWLRIDGGPMQTAEGGETLRFGLLNVGLAQLIATQSHPAPRSATL